MRKENGSFIVAEAVLLVPQERNELHEPCLEPGCALYVVIVQVYGGPHNEQIRVVQHSVW